jgi:hypothetical protein
MQNSHRVLINPQCSSLSNSQTSQILPGEFNSPLLEGNGQNNRRRSRVTLILCALYLLGIIYFTIVFKNAKGFHFRATICNDFRVACYAIYDL